MHICASCITKTTPSTFYNLKFENSCFLKISKYYYATLINYYFIIYTYDIYIVKKQKSELEKNITFKHLQW